MSKNVFMWLTVDSAHLLHSQFMVIGECNSLTVSCIILLSCESVYDRFRPVHWWAVGAWLASNVRMSRSDSHMPSWLAGLQAFCASLSVISGQFKLVSAELGFLGSRLPLVIIITILQQQLNSYCESVCIIQLLKYYTLQEFDTQSANGHKLLKSIWSAVIDLHFYRLMWIKP